MSLDRLDGPIRLAGIEAGVPPVSALPDRFPPGRAVPWPGEAPAARGETPPSQDPAGEARPARVLWRSRQATMPSRARAVSPRRAVCRRNGAIPRAASAGR
jgi:hypothetical protein